MILRRLTLKNFRNLRSCELFPDQRINILCGDNGQGKTNLLEAIYLLSHLGTFRPTPQKNLIHSEMTWGRVQGVVEDGGMNKEIALTLQPRNKEVRIDGKTVSRGIDFFGTLNVTLFSPESLGVVKGAPELRRRFLDRAISRLDRRYLYDLKEYRRILDQRNRLLRMIRDGRVSRGEVGVWSDQLAQTGSRILQARYRFLKDYAPLSATTFGALAHKGMDLRILYSSTLIRCAGASTSGALDDPARLRRNFLAAFEQKEEEEIISGTTKIGPHLDDLLFEVGGRPAKTFASQGECRMLALALTLSEAELYRVRKGTPPVLLLDDVTSELDPRHRRLLSRFLRSAGQVFLTTTEENLDEKLDVFSTRFHIKKGEIALVKKGEKL
jgi:DNA replication and repair protein RecF